MVFTKFSLVFILLTSAVLAQVPPMRFSPKSCLDAHYTMKMVQKGPLFGLLKQEFIIKKKDCILKVTHRKYMPKEWIIDVCREPVHIKVTSATGVDVAKKDEDCFRNDKSKDNSDFCSQYYELTNVIQDDGLIFADGDRDDLNSNHGQTFCSYLLIKKYLNDSVIFSRYTEVPDIFLEKPKPQAPLIKTEEPQADNSKGTPPVEPLDKKEVI